MKINKTYLTTLKKPFSVTLEPLFQNSLSQKKEEKKNK